MTASTVKDDARQPYPTNQFFCTLVRLKEGSQQQLSSTIYPTQISWNSIPCSNHDYNNHEESETSSTDNEELSRETNALQTSLDKLRDEKQEFINDSIMKNEECLINEEYLAEFEIARSGLSAERSNVASTDVLLPESKMLLGNMRRDLKDALEKNKMLTGKVDNLETSIEKSQQTNAQTLKESETHVLINKETSEKIQYLEKEIKLIRPKKESLLKRPASKSVFVNVEHGNYKTHVNNERIPNSFWIIGIAGWNFCDAKQKLENPDLNRVDPNQINLHLCF